MNSHQGFDFEAQLSHQLHSKYPALLLSGKLLREYGAGQVDVAFIKDDCVHIVEAKLAGNLTRIQFNRLNNSARLISHLLNCGCQLWLAKKLLPNGIRFFNLNS